MISLSVSLSLSIHVEIYMSQINLKWIQISQINSFLRFGGFLLLIILFRYNYFIGFYYRVRSHFVITFGKSIYEPLWPIRLCDLVLLPLFVRSANVVSAKNENRDVIYRRICQWLFCTKRQPCPIDYIHFSLGLEFCFHYEKSILERQMKDENYFLNLKEKFLQGLIIVSIL